MCERQLMALCGVDGGSRLIDAYLAAPPGTAVGLSKGHQEGRPEVPMLIVKLGGLIAAFTLLEAEGLALAAERLMRGAPGERPEGAADLAELINGLRAAVREIEERATWSTPTVH